MGLIVIVTTFSRDHSRKQGVKIDLSAANFNTSDSQEWSKPYFSLQQQNTATQTRFENLTVKGPDPKL